MVKFCKHISEYDYILSFDLAKYSSGYTLLDLKNKQVVECGLVSCQDNCQDSFWTLMFNKITEVLYIVKRKYKNFFVIKEKLPSQSGKFTTIDSLQSLAMAHAVWEIACTNCGVEVYDYDGISALTAKAIIRHHTGIQKPEKKDVAEYLTSNYSFIIDPETYDVTDSLACTVALIENKWNKDIKDEIKGQKKLLEKYKSDKKKNEILNRIEELNKLLIQEE